MKKVKTDMLKHPTPGLVAHKQKGAVLIISLIMLLIMTLVGLAAMNTSLLQERMASNAQNTNRTFQAAESAIGNLIATIINTAALNSNAELGTAMNSATNQAPMRTFNVADPNVSSNFQVTYLGEVTLPIGHSNDADESSTSIKAQRFDVAGLGNVPATNSQSIIRQGIEYY